MHTHTHAQEQIKEWLSEASRKWEQETERFCLQMSFLSFPLGLFTMSDISFLVLTSPSYLPDSQPGSRKSRGKGMLIAGAYQASQARLNHCVHGPASVLESLAFASVFCFFVCFFWLDNCYAFFCHY